MVTVKIRYTFGDGSEFEGEFAYASYEDDPQNDADWCSISEEEPLFRGFINEDELLQDLESELNPLLDSFEEEYGLEGALSSDAVFGKRTVGYLLGLGACA